jgi:hypothetical protein
MASNTKDLIQRAVSKYNYERISTPWYFPCLGMGMASSLQLGTTRYMNQLISFKRCINFERFNAPGIFEVQLFKIIYPVLFPMILDQKEVIVVDPKNLVYQYLIQKAVSKCNYERISTPCYFPCLCIRRTSSFFIQETSCINQLISFERTNIIWITGRFRITTVKDSRPSVVSRAFRGEGRHHCHFERPRVSSCRINVPTIWFRWQFGSESNFEVQLCENTRSALFPMLFDENDVIVGIPKDLVYQVVDRKLIQRADLKYNHERILAPRYFRCFSFRIVSSLWLRPGVPRFRTDLIQRAILKHNYEGFSTPCYFLCFWMRMMPSLSFR